MPPRISVFPKCWFDELADGRMALVDWIRQAAALGGEGVEHYDGFFRSLAPRHVDPVIEAMEETGQITSMICFSPDFTHEDPEERGRQVERQKAAIDLTVRLGARHCRTLSGQRYPGLSRAEGIARTLDGIRRSLEHAERRGVVLCMENHYKDGLWRYPEFAQAEDIFLEIIEQIESPFFGVQYDPSNATVGGYDPIGFLERVKHRVVTVHASDRYLAPGATLDMLAERDGATGYADVLRHGETGAGLNDYDAIFRLLAGAGFSGWISIEDGMNGLDEIRRSAEFLKAKRTQYFGPAGVSA
ncbi:MAG TPA: sugar phosphate isomerase/epimerase family protein [Vicinamibacterales bacterium]|nr:sugar phosphate isomerase/epimerase family protein [Vicinamibacterales bacterium]